MFATLGLLVTAAAQMPITVDGELCHPQNLLVKYSDRAIVKRLKTAAPVIRDYPEIGYAVIKVPLGKLKTSRANLSRMPGIVRVDLDRCSKPAYDPNDEFWPNEWHMQAIHTNLAWDLTKGDSSVVVAVIDTGVKVDHPDLVDSIWVNSDEIPGNGIDDDGNGYIDDVNGFDFPYNDGDPNDVHGHGTACAGIVAGTQDNLIGVSGVAPHCKVMALKAAEDSGFFYDSNNIGAYLYAANNGAKVLSMSFFSDRVSQAERDAIDYCWTHGVLPVAAAGNAASIYPYYPGGYENVLSVAAVGGNLNKAGFSNYGSWVDVSAPGTGIYTTTNDGGYTSGFGGTSGACPHVAGVAALCFSAKPNATNAEVRYAIENTATLQNQAPYGEFSNYGLVDAEKAVLRMNGGAASPHPPRVAYLTRLAKSLGSRKDSRHFGRIYGRGFGAGNTVQVKWNGLNIPLIAKSRDWVDFSVGAAHSSLTVFVNGEQIAQFPYTESTLGFAYLLTEASTQGATLTGGFLDALNPDTNVIRCDTRENGDILVQSTFRQVIPTATMQLVLRRNYTVANSNEETVWLYDWSSASYPYGNWVPLGTGPCPTTMTTSTYSVPNASRFVDFEGTVYMLITTTEGLPTGTEIRIDQSRLISQ